jgi:predicted metal-dependent peptidase
MASNTATAPSAAVGSAEAQKAAKDQAMKALQRDTITGVDQEGNPITVTKDEIEALKFETKKAMVHLYNSFPFWALLIERCNLVCTLRIPTACVTPKGVIMYNPFFFRELNHAQRMFVLAHEVAHVAFHFFDRLQGRELRLFNEAQDYIINFLLHTDFKSSPKYARDTFMPDGLLFSEHVGKLTSEEIYEMLVLKKQQGAGGQGQTPGQGQGQQQQQQQQQNGQGQQDPNGQQQQNGQGQGQQQQNGQGQGQNQGGSAQGMKLRDQNPDAWRDFQNGFAGRPDNAQGGMGGDCLPTPGDGDVQLGDGLSAEDWGQIEEWCNDGDALIREAGGDTPETYEDWDTVVSQAATQAKMQGQLPAHLEKFVEDFLQPKVHWTRQFQAALGVCATRDVRQDYSWMMPSRRQETYGNLVMPTIAGSRSKGIFAVDTSGSMYATMRDTDKMANGRTYMEQAISEVEAIRKQHEIEIYLMNCDAALHRGEWIKPYEPMPSLKGGGGTSFKPIFKHIEEEDLQPDFVCVITDGWGDFPKEAPPYDVIWISFATDDFPFGDVIKIEV